jgi:hypothetical protein
MDIRTPMVLVGYTVLGTTNTINLVPLKICIYEHYIILLLYRNQRHARSSAHARLRAFS